MNYNYLYSNHFSQYQNIPSGTLLVLEWGLCILYRYDADGSFCIWIKLTNWL